MSTEKKNGSGKRSATAPMTSAAAARKFLRLKLRESYAAFVAARAAGACASA